MRRVCPSRLRFATILNKFDDLSAAFLRRRDQLPDVFRSLPQWIVGKMSVARRRADLRVSKHRANDWKTKASVY